MLSDQAIALLASMRGGAGYTFSRAFMLRSELCYALPVAFVQFVGGI
jgi:hypothetical protein